MQVHTGRASEPGANSHGLGDGGSSNLRGVWTGGLESLDARTDFASCRIIFILYTQYGLYGTAYMGH